MFRRKKIFLSYRRGDTAGHVGRLHDELVRVFGADRVFMDVGGIAPGDDFVRMLRRQLTESNVVLVAIGQRWAGTHDAAPRRLDDPNDFVRLEVATALATSQTRVIPVLCEGAEMPSESELPRPLATLAHRQAFVLRDTHWRHDLPLLLAAISAHVPVAGRAKRATLRATTALVLLTLTLLGATWAVQSIVARFRRDARQPGNQAPPLASTTRTARTPARDVPPVSPNVRESRTSTSGVPRANGESRMPDAPKLRVIPANVVGTAQAQLARAQREWVDDATITSIDINCAAGREGQCPMHLQFASSSRFAILDATRSDTDSAWSYRQRTGSSRTPSLSLDIVEFSRILAAMQADGVAGELDRATLEHVRVSTGDWLPRWTVFPRDRRQAGREGRLCYEPQSGARVDCRTGQ